MDAAVVDQSAVGDVFGQVCFCLRDIAVRPGIGYRGAADGAFGLLLNLRGGICARGGIGPAARPSFSPPTPLQRL